MIVQRENDNQMVMLPIANLVNGASARVKLNDKATFKPDINCRKQERGVIVLFGEWLFPFWIELALFVGSEDICTEQLQVLNMSDDDQENHDPDHGHEHNRNDAAARSRTNEHQFKSRSSSGQYHESVSSLIC